MAQGIAIYASGDLVAALILGQFSWLRLAGMMVVGGTIYALEVPHYFRWIDKTVTTEVPLHRALARTGLALLYFNPLWIARHLAFIALVSGRFGVIDWQLMRLGALSWAVNIPLAIVANYFIQVKLSLHWRFAASAVFSALMAIYYACSEVLFRG